MSQRKHKKHYGIYLILHVLKRVLKKDDEYIRKVLLLEDDPDYIRLKHNGNTDYGNIIYVVKENSGHDGFCATISFIICFLIFAEQHGFIPKIKLTKEFTYFDKEMNRKISNPWEYYFLTTDDDIDESRALNVCYARYTHMNTIRKQFDINTYKTKNYHDDRLFRVCSPIIRKYLRLKPSIVSESNELLKEIKENNGKVLGVHFRGTDYKQSFTDHPVFVSEEQTIAGIKKALKTKCFAAVFLATDDALIYEKIHAAINDKELLMFTDVYRSDGNTSVAFSENVRKYHHYLLGYEIARDMYTLSLCDGLVAGKSSVSFLSNLYKHSRNEEYEYLHIIDNGNNKNGKSFIE